MSRIRRIAPGLGRGGLLGNTEGPEAYLRELDTLPSQFCRATGGTETVISQGGKYYRVHTFTDTDPTSLLLNFDGSNGSTTFTDDSGWGHAVTANGGAAISTTQSVFGGSSLYLDGTGDYLSVANVSQFDFGTGDFTIEGWIYSTKALDSTNDTILDTRPLTNTTGVSYDLFVLTNGVLRFGLRENSVETYYDATSVLSANTWYHIAVCRSGNNLRLFVDGALETTSDVSGKQFNARSVARIGYKTLDISGLAYWQGYIDSLRITKGQALYTAAFTPPTTALTRVGSGSLSFTRGGVVEYLVVGGGGGGGGWQSGLHNGGGGGAGGFRTGSGVVTSSSQTVSVGGGGSGGASGGANSGTSGSDSAFAFITAAGGGGGGSGGNGLDGGSGGGGSLSGATGTATGGSGNVPAASPAQGYDGETIVNSSYTGGGGGGASEAGGTDALKAGGDGVSSEISGSSVTYAGGGGGGGGGAAGAGGDGGGGTEGGDGTANTGGGGGGGYGVSAGTGGDGGSGIVIVRYQITQAEYEAEAA